LRVIEIDEKLRKWQILAQKFIDLFCNRCFRLLCLKRNRMAVSIHLAKWLQFVLLLALGLLLTWLALRGQDLVAIWDRMVTARWGWIVLSLVLTLLGHLSRARRWQLLIQGTGHDVGLLACFVAMMTGYLSNLGIPRIGELGRCASLARLSAAPILALGGTVVAERVVDLLTFAGLVAITFLAAGERVLGFWAREIAAPLQSLWGWRLVVVLLVAASGIALLGWFAMRRRSADTWPLWGRLQGWARGLWDGMWSAARTRRPAEFVLHTVLIWMGYYAAPLCALLALDLGGDDLMSLAFYAFVFGSLARTLPLPAGSMGAYHYLISQLMVALGYTYLDGISLATLNHAVQTAFYLLFGLLGMLGFFVMLRLKGNRA
jgi:glycosyltransferase 2 family protein